MKNIFSLGIIIYGALWGNALWGGNKKPEPSWKEPPHDARAVITKNLKNGGFFYIFLRNDATEFVLKFFQTRSLKNIKNTHCLVSGFWNQRTWHYTHPKDFSKKEHIFITPKDLDLKNFEKDCDPGQNSKKTLLEKRFGISPYGFWTLTEEGLGPQGPYKHCVKGGCYPALLLHENPVAFFQWHPDLLTNTALAKSLKPSIIHLEDSYCDICHKHSQSMKKPVANFRKNLEKK